MERGQALREGRWTGRRGLIGLAPGVCLLAALAVLPTAPATAKHHKAVAVHFKGAQSDQAVLSAGAIPVSIRSSRPRKVELSVTAFQGGPSLAGPKRVRLRRGHRSMSLPLSTAGRDVLEGCGASGLTVTATKSKKRKKGRRKTLGRASAPIAQSVPQCEVLTRADRCETIASPGTNCLIPFPSDHYTVADSGTPTGRRVNINKASTPTNLAGTHVDPAEINTSDGFSPGALIVTRVPGMDTPTAFEQTGPVPITNMGEFDPTRRSS